MGNKKAYQSKFLVAGVIMGLGCLVPSYVNWVAGVSLLSEYPTLLVQTAVAVGVFIIYGKKEAELADTEGNGYSYSKAWGFALMASVVAGVVVAAGSMLLAKVLHPELEAEMVHRAIVEAGEQPKEVIKVAVSIVKFQYTILGMSFGSVFSMAFFGGFIGLFTSIVVKRQPKI